MNALKWNYKTKDYEPCEIPEGASLNAPDMETVITCAQCACKLTYGNGYTSRVIHSRGGYGYSVCESCYELERREERKKANR